MPNSKNYIACFSDVTGRRLQRSTGTAFRKEAQKVAEQYVEADRKVKTEAQVRKVLSDLFEKMGDAPLPSGTIRAYLAA